MDRAINCLGQSAELNYLLYVGTYTGEESRGIYAFHYKCSSAPALTPIGLVARAENPSFLAVDPSNRFVYVVEEIKYCEKEATGLLSAYAIERTTGALNLLGKVKSHGSIPCHVSVDQAGRYVFSANYAGGTLAVFCIAPDGMIGEARAVVRHFDHQASNVEARRPHPHAVYSDCKRFVFVPDLGLDRLFVYRLRDDGGLEAQERLAFELPQGSGPRHLAFHPVGNLTYVLNESNSTISVLRCDDAREKFECVQTISTLPDDFHGESSTAEIEIDNEGRFLYVSNRGADTIAVFSVQDCGCLSRVEQVATGGECPRHFAISPGGKHLLVANQHTNNIVVFERDPVTGKLNPTGHSCRVHSPACLIFVPHGH